MATAILTVTDSLFPSYFGATFNGGATGAECLAVALDGKTVTANGPQTYGFSLQSNVDLTTATINSAQVKFTMTTNSVDWTTGNDSWVGTTDNTGSIDLNDIYPLFDTAGVWSSAVMATNPSTGNPWQVGELVWNGVSLEGVWYNGIANASGTFATIDYIEVVVDYTAGTNAWWKLPTATGPFLLPGAKINDVTMDWPIFNDTVDGCPVVYTAPSQTISICSVSYPLASAIQTPTGLYRFPSLVPQTDFTQTYNYYYFGQQPTTDWTQTNPSNQGWFWSVEGFQGGDNVTVGGKPADPRAFVKIAGFATGNAGVFGGSPGVGVIYNNHLIYASNDYTLGTTAPNIHVFDGRSDRELVALPNTTAGAIPKGILSMLVADGVIYISTYDSGTSAADFAGRVFKLDPLSASLTVMGDVVFTTGHLPYTLAWHMDRLWVGTNKGDGTTGKIYYLRPGIDTTWTLDYTLSSSSVGGACSMRSFQGKLMIGTDAGAAVFGKVLARSPDGTYATSDTGSGGTAKVNNGFLAMAQLGDNLYVSYFNNDTTKISYIRKYTGSAWSTAYTGSGATLKPFLGMFIEANKLYAIGGGLQLQAALVNTPDGTTWSDLTAFIPGSTATGIPIFGTVSL